MKKLKRNLVFLYIGSFLVSIAPLLAVLIARWNVYTKTPGDTVKLCIGGVICLFFILLKVIGKLKMPSRIVLFGVVFALVYLLKAILDDLLLLSGMALAGELLDMLFFQMAIRRTKERILIEKTSTATAEKVEEVIKKYIGRV
jgi:hypothetical protein